MSDDIRCGNCGIPIRRIDGFTSKTLDEPICDGCYADELDEREKVVVTNRQKCDCGNEGFYRAVNGRIDYVPNDDGVMEEEENNTEFDDEVVCTDCKARYPACEFRWE